MQSVTVNIVSYGYGHLVAQALESVLAQSRPPTKVVVWDDGVGDCAHVTKLYPGVPVVQRVARLGIVRNFNDILESTDSVRCLMLGADNYLRPDALEKMGQLDSDIVSSDIAFFGELSADYKAQAGARATWHGYGLREFRGGDIERGNYIHGSSLFSTQKAKSAGGYSASGSPTKSEEDWIMFRAMLRAGATHHHVPTPLLFYRRHRLNYQK